MSPIRSAAVGSEGEGRPNGVAMNANDVCPGCLEEGVKPPGILFKPPRPTGVSVVADPQMLICTKPDNPHTYPDDLHETKNVKR